jgi:hypothetical protein
VSPAPAPIEADRGRMVRWAQVLTGLELDENGAVHVLDGAAWRQLREQLEKSGGALGLPPRRAAEEAE